MAPTNVSSCVLSIIGSFSSGLDVFKKLREKRKKRRRTRRNCQDIEREEERESRLSRSLRRGPEDIGREYARSVHAVGEGFGVGDGIAQTSLAEILLKLNTGLVSIITTFLNTDRREGAQLDNQALTSLSDHSRVETCKALRQLFQRMTAPKPVPALPPPKQHNRRRSESPKRSHKRSHSSSRAAKIKGPMIARVVIENSSRPSQIAIVKPSDRRKKSGASSSSDLSKAPSMPSTPPPEYVPEMPPRPVATMPKPQRMDSGIDIELARALSLADRPVAARSTPQLHATTSFSDFMPPLPAAQPVVNVQQQQVLPRHRKQTLTYYSIASDSTRLGEIPLHKWAVAPDFDQMSVLNREAERTGWAARSEIGEGRKERWGLRRLFGRRG